MCKPRYKMIKFKFFKKILFFISITVVNLFVFACNQSNKESNLEISVEAVAKTNDYKYYDIFGISPCEIIIPKNQTISQSLSVVVSNGKGELIVFDGGRVEDADYLIDIIKEYGGKVKYWFLTHIHDDHIGALLKILLDKRIDIKIDNLYYDFASFDWYYDKIGDDAGIYILFIDAINDYNDYLSKNEIETIKVTTDYIKYNSEVNNDNKSTDIKVNILNKHYELDQDPINNTSIVYLVTVNNTKMLIFGDLGYRGGEILFSDKFENNDIDIIVLAHHGQDGVDPIHYKNFKPKVIVWPTSEDIFRNTHGRYLTDDTKNALKEIESIKYQIKSYEKTAVIR